MDDGTWFFFVLIAGVITGFIGLWIAKQKGRSKGEGFLLGFLLSVIGLIVEGLLPEVVKSNPVRRVSKADSRILGLGDPEQTKEPQRLSADGRPLRKCPFCAEMVLSEAIICRYCQRDLPAVPASEPDPLPELNRKDDIYFAQRDGSLYHRKGCPCIPDGAQGYPELGDLPNRYQPCCFCSPHKAIPT